MTPRAPKSCYVGSAESASPIGGLVKPRTRKQKARRIVAIQRGANRKERDMAKDVKIKGKSAAQTVKVTGKGSAAKTVKVTGKSAAQTVKVSGRKSPPKKG
jgi:hypothetical protein